MPNSSVHHCCFKTNLVQPAKLLYKPPPMTKDKTIATHAGLKPFENHGVVNPPVYHASTILFETYQDMKDAVAGKTGTPYYGRHGTAPYRQLEEAIAKLEGADKCLITNSGVTAIAVTLLALLEPGDELLMVDSAYSPTRDFCNEELKRYDISTRYYDPLIGGDIADQIAENTKVVFVESPGSLTLELQDIPAIAEAAHAKGAVVVMDNTWATPLYYKSFSHGVDVAIHSATKYIGGHSDLLMGVINCRKEFYPQLKRVYKNLGICPGPDDIYLAQRGLRTLPTRLEAQGKSALELATWLQTHDKVSKILHPAFPDCPNHEIFKRDYLGSSGLFSIILNKHLSDDELAKFFDEMKLFKLGFSWGGYESLILPYTPQQFRSATKWEAEGTLIRLSIGLEDIEDLQEELASALDRIS